MKSGIEPQCFQGNYFFIIDLLKKFLSGADSSKAFYYFCVSLQSSQIESLPLVQGKPRDIKRPNVRMLFWLNNNVWANFK